ncbi:hypothetical protein D3C76_1684320 [compost metagenome]
MVVLAMMAVLAGGDAVAQVLIVTGGARKGGLGPAVAVAVPGNTAAEATHTLAAQW